MLLRHVKHYRHLKHHLHVVNVIFQKPRLGVRAFFFTLLFFATRLRSAFALKKKHPNQVVVFDRSRPMFPDCLKYAPAPRGAASAANAAPLEVAHP